jgi:hypothetical protein
MTITDNTLIVTVQQEGLVSAQTNLNNPLYLETLDNVGDVDMLTNGKENGSVLVYKTNTSKWTSTRTLDLQIMEGGEF